MSCRVRESSENGVLSDDVGLLDVFLGEDVKSYGCGGVDIQRGCGAGALNVARAANGRIPLDDGRANRGGAARDVDPAAGGVTAVAAGEYRDERSGALASLEGVPRLVRAGTTEREVVLNRAA